MTKNSLFGRRWRGSVSSFRSVKAANTEATERQSLSDEEVPPEWHKDGKAGTSSASRKPGRRWRRRSTETTLKEPPSASTLVSTPQTDHSSHQEWESPASIALSASTPSPPASPKGSPTASVAASTASKNFRYPPRLSSDERRHHMEDPLIRLALEKAAAASSAASLGETTATTSASQLSPERINRITKEAEALDKSGNDLMERGLYDQAMARYAQALKLKQKSLKATTPAGESRPLGMEPDHDPSATVAGGVDGATTTATSHDDQKDAQAKEALLASVATSINNLTYIQQRSGTASTEETLASYMKSLQIKRDILGPDHLSVGKTLNNIASVYYLKRDYEASLIAYEEACRIMTKQLGQEHLDVGTVISNIGDVHYATGQHQLALDHYRRALPIRWSNLGHRDPKVVRLMEQISALEVGLQPKREDDEYSMSEASEFVEEDRRREEAFKEDLHVLQQELEEDVKFFDLHIREAAIEALQDKARIFRHLREQRYDDSEDEVSDYGPHSPSSGRDNVIYPGEEVSPLSPPHPSVPEKFPVLVRLSPDPDEVSKLSPHDMPKLPSPDPPSSDEAATTIAERVEEHKPDPAGNYQAEGAVERSPTHSPEGAKRTTNSKWSAGRKPLSAEPSLRSLEPIFEETPSGTSLPPKEMPAPLDPEEQVTEPVRDERPSPVTATLQPPEDDALKSPAEASPPNKDKTSSPTASERPEKAESASTRVPMVAARASIDHAAHLAKNPKSTKAPPAVSAEERRERLMATLTRPLPENSHMASRYHPKPRSPTSGTSPSKIPRYASSNRDSGRPARKAMTVEERKDALTSVRERLAKLRAARGYADTKEPTKPIEQRPYMEPTAAALARHSAPKSPAQKFLRTAGGKTVEIESGLRNSPRGAELKGSSSRYAKTVAPA